MAAILPAGEIAAFEASFGRQPKKAIRVNTLKISQKDFEKIAHDMGWTLTPIPWSPCGYYIDRPSYEVPLGKTWLHMAGLFYIQEAASQLPAELLGVRAGETVLDMAAAPGSKTTQMAAAMGNTGMIVANEPSGERIKSLAFNLDQAGAMCVCLMSRDGGEIGYRAPNSFDRVLLDAPCTGEGTARKDSSVFSRWHEKNAEKISQLQKRLIVSAFHALRPGGRMVYSTCTYGPEENEAVASFLLSVFPNEASIVPTPKSNGVTEFFGEKYDARVMGCMRLFPQSDGSEGFFACIIEKTGATYPDVVTKQRYRDEVFLPLSEKAAAGMLREIREYFGCDVVLSESVHLVRREKELWIQPRGAAGMQKKIPLERSGVCVARLSGKNSIERYLQGVVALLKNPTRHVVDVDKEMLRKYVGGGDVYGCRNRNGPGAGWGDKESIAAGAGGAVSGMCRWVDVCR